MSDSASAQTEVFAGSRGLLIFPCNGNGIEALDCLGRDFTMLGFIDDMREKQGTKVYGHEVLARTAFRKWPDAMVLGVPGSSTSYLMRCNVIAGLGVEASRFARVIHPQASVSPLARLGRNVLVMAGVVVTSNADIGDHVCLLPNTVVHHDARIGAGTLVGANVTIAGGTIVGTNCYIGAGSSIMNGLRIGDRTLIGLGSNVIRDTAPDSRVAGNPARPVVTAH